MKSSVIYASFDKNVSNLSNFFARVLITPAVRNYDRRVAPDCMTKTLVPILTVIGIVIVISIILAVWSAHQPVPSRPDIGVLFVGYTNDRAGARFAAFQ